MKKILVGLVLVPLSILAGMYFVGAFSSALITSQPATLVATGGGGMELPDPTPVGGESMPPDEGGENNGGSSCSPSLNPGDFSWVWWVILIAWCATRFTSKWKWDDYILYIGSLGCLVLSFTSKGCLGDWSPMSAGWWLAECVWVIGIIPYALDPYVKKRYLKWLFFIIGWYLLGVFS